MMILVFVIGVIIFLIVNGGLYLSALFCLKLGFKSFPKKSFFLIWPAMLLGGNVYFGVIQNSQIKEKYSEVKAGIVYETKPTPSHVAIMGYSSTPSNFCNTLCQELLFEGHVNYVTVIWDNLQKGERHKAKNVTFRAREGNCIQLGESLRQSSLIHAFHGYCVESVEDSTTPSVVIILDSNLNYFRDSILGGRLSNYRHGIAIFDNMMPQKNLMAIHAKYTPEVIKLPLRIKAISSAGFEMNMKFDSSFATRRLEDPAMDEKQPFVSYKEQRVRQKADRERIAAEKHALMLAALGFELNGEINPPNYLKPSPEDAAKMIREIFESKENAHVKRILVDAASKFSLSYEGFPFLDLMKEFDTGEKTRAAHLAQSYIGRWLRVNDSATYKKNMADRKQKREAAEKKRKFEAAKRFCELEARRAATDGYGRAVPDCSQYQAPKE